METIFASCVVVCCWLLARIILVPMQILHLSDGREKERERGRRRKKKFDAMSLLILTERAWRFFFSSLSFFFIRPSSNRNGVFLLANHILFFFFKTIINESKLIEYLVLKKEKSFGKKPRMSRWCVIVLIENDVIIVEVGRK